MARRLAMVAAVQSPLNASLPTAPYAEDGATALAKALREAGYDEVLNLNRMLLTRAAFDSRWKQLRKQVRKGDTLLLVYLGSALLDRNQSYLNCWDTLPDDLPTTALAVADLWQDLQASKASDVALWLDVGQQPAGLANEELVALTADSPKGVIQTSCEAGEQSQASANLGCSVWVRLVLDALSGRVPTALKNDGTLTAFGLQKHLERETPRLLRKHFAGGIRQHPEFYGEAHAETALANLGHLIRAASGLLDPERLKWATFRSVQSVRVKDLQGFHKKYQLPDRATPSSKKFIARCAHADVVRDLDDIFQAVRDHLGYKRKDVETTTGPDGFGHLRSPDFEYSLTVELDETDPTQVLFRREIGNLSDLAFVRSPGFQAVFNSLIDSIAFEFTEPVDVEAFVDRLEDSPLPNVQVNPEPDGSACEMALRGFAGSVRLERTSMVLRGRAGNSSGLLDQFLGFLQTFGGLGQAKALPPSSG